MQFLHNDQFFAAAQKKYVYIYDKRGIEVHCLKVRAVGPRSEPEHLKRHQCTALGCVMSSLRDDEWHW